MERDRLTRLLEEPARVAREDLSGLRDLTEEYPWFAGAHLLRSMAEHVQGELSSGAGMQQAAAHLPSREVLYDLVHGPGHLSPLTPVAKEQAPVQEAEVAPAAPTPPSAAMEIEERRPVEETPMDHTEAEPLPAPVPTEEEPQDAPTHEDPSQDILERQMLEAVLASSYELTRDVMLAGPVVPPPPAAVPPVEVPWTRSGPTAEVEPPSPTRTPAVNVPKGGRLRFTEWLTADTATVGAKPEPPTATPTAPVEPAKIAAPVVPADTGTLIDRFILSQHPEPRPKAEFFTPQQAAKRSLEERSGLVTETLARIYEQQGRLDKAMEAYRKLALKYPEKSAYFAALEKGLQGRMNK